MLNLINLGEMYYEKKCGVSGFLFGSLGVEEMRERKIVILGTGLNSFLCTCLLEKNGLQADTYCENFAPLVGTELASKKIASSYETFRNKKDDYYFISTVDKQYANDVCNQFFVYGVEYYSLFYAYKFDKSGIKELNDLMLKCMNLIINNSYGYPKTLTNNIVGRQTHPRRNGIIELLLSAPGWYRPLLEWLYADIVSNKSGLKVLEISPGSGFASLVLKYANPGFNLDWICFNKEESVGEAYIDIEDKNFKVTKYNGLIEDPRFNIPGKYDIIFLTEVFEHFAFNPLDVTKKLANALKDNGRLYLSTPNWGHLYTYETWKDMPPFQEDGEDYLFWHCYQYSKSELLEIFGAAGLAVKNYAVSSNNHHNFMLEKSR